MFVSVVKVKQFNSLSNIQYLSNQHHQYKVTPQPQQLMLSKKMWFKSQIML